ncbi:SDR family oxidoreductase [Variovorax paradoxus]|nr:SDR family oxidoreductase [Variovorax paradoxus]MBT2304848.1 SDR family oxidoreductase [Variovorax paradoxus]
MRDHGAWRLARRSGRPGPGRGRGDGREVIKVNIEGTFGATRVFAARMARTGGGAIVNVASIVGHASSPQHAYGSTTAAVLNITKNFAAQYGKGGVRFNSVSPGAVLVPRVKARAPGRYAVDIDAQMALGRRIQPNEIGDGIEFLLSDRASAITGIDLMIAGWDVATKGTIPAPRANARTPSPARKKPVRAPARSGAARSRDTADNGMVDSMREEVAAYRKDLIVRAASDAFFEHGYYDCTVDMIAERLSGTKAIVYYYFADKHAILEEIYPRAMAEA